MWVKKKGNQDSILNLKKSTRFWSFRLGQGWLLRNDFCKAGQNCIRPSFEFVTQCSAGALIVALLWKLSQMPSCSANNMDKNNFDVFYQIEGCAAINGRIWMNNIPNENIIIMLSCTEICFVISLFNLEKFGVKPGLPFFTLYIYMFSQETLRTSFGFQNCKIHKGKMQMNFPIFSCRTEIKIL